MRRWTNQILNTINVACKLLNKSQLPPAIKIKKTHLWSYSVHLFMTDSRNDLEKLIFLPFSCGSVIPYILLDSKPILVVFDLLTKRVGLFGQPRQGSGSPVCSRFAFIRGKQPLSHRSPPPLCSPHSWSPSLPPHRLVMNPILRDVFILPPIVSLATSWLLPFPISMPETVRRN